MRGLTRDGKSIEFTVTKSNELLSVYGVDTTLDVSRVYASATHENGGKK
jgi:hypothetical protein